MKFLKSLSKFRIFFSIATFGLSFFLHIPSIMADTPAATQRCSSVFDKNHESLIEYLISFNASKPRETIEIPVSLWHSNRKKITEEFLSQSKDEQDSRLKNFLLSDFF